MTRISAALTWLALAAAALPATASEELAKKHACIGCHGVDKKIVGPAYKDVAGKYRGDKEAPARLQEKVKKGSVGVWGQVPMPPNAGMKDEDVKALVAWILSLK